MLKSTSFSLKTTKNGKNFIDEIHVSHNWRKAKSCSPSTHTYEFCSLKIKFTFFQVTIWGDYGRIEGKKVFMGVAQIMLDDLDLSNIVIGWYKLFGTSSLVSVPPSGPKMKPDGLKSSLESLKTESYGWVRFRQMLIFSNSTNTKSSDSRGLAWKKKNFLIIY